MILYKLNNGRLMQAPKSIVNDSGQMMTNPSQAMLLADGWLPLIIDEQPSYDKYSQELSGYFEQEVDAIYQRWQVREKPYNPEAPITRQELVDMLSEGVNSIV